MRIVGLTGGISSGKTHASSSFVGLGIDIIDADEISRSSVAVGSAALDAIAQHFGRNILLADGNLDRAALRQRIFSANEDKTWLEALLHPIIRKHTISALQRASSPYVILSSPLLIETEQTKLVDRVLIIDIPVELQIARATLRDGNSEEQIKRIIDSQVSRKIRLDYADDIIDNSGTTAECEQQVALLHQKYLNLAEKG
jgi:dephospho-CoA kinase